MPDPVSSEAPPGSLPGSTPAEDITGTDHADIDPATGQSAGAGIEPEEGASREPMAADPPPPATPEAPTEELPPNPRDEAMEAILQNRRDQIEKEVETAREQEPEAMAELETQAGTPPEPTQPPAVNPDAGDPDPGRQPIPAESTGEPAPGFQITVYGQEQTVTQEQAIEAGLQTLQKERAGDHRIEQARLYEGELNNYRGRLDNYRGQLLQGRGADGQPLAATPEGAQQPVAGQAQPPTGAVEPTAVITKEQASGVMGALYSGDQDQAAEALAGFMTDALKGRTATPPSVDVEAVAARSSEIVMTNLQAEAQETDRVNANEVFRDEYPIIHDDPVLFAAARAQLAQLQADPVNQNRPLDVMARETGAFLSKRFGLSTPGAGPTTPTTPNPVVPEAELVTRRELKERTPVPPVSERPAQRHSPPPEERPPTGSEYVSQLRAQRGLPPL